MWRGAAIGTTPAAVLARIKVQHPAWTITRVDGGKPHYIAERGAVNGGYGGRPRPARRIVAGGLGELERRLSADEGL
jgi:hypothetical protein